MPTLPQADGGWEYWRFGGAKLTRAISVSAAGDTAIVTPSATQYVSLLWVALSSSAGNAAETIATVRLGSQVLYMWNMTQPGAFSHWEPVVGNWGDALVVNLTAPQAVLFNYTYTLT
jgi:hypothetical protein